MATIAREFFLEKAVPGGELKAKEFDIETIPDINTLISDRIKAAISE